LVVPPIVYGGCFSPRKFCRGSTVEANQVFFGVQEGEFASSTAIDNENTKSCNHCCWARAIRIAFAETCGS
jgi:hypothetical protein